MRIILLICIAMLCLFPPPAGAAPTLSTPPSTVILADPTDPYYALDHTLLYASQSGGDVLALFAAGLALLGTAWSARRRHGPSWAMPTSVLLGIAFAALHGLYALIRLGHVTVTSKPVEFSSLALIGTGLLTGCGAFLFLRARSRLSKGSALLVATFPAWAAAVFGLGSVAVFNLLFFRPRLGVELYNHALGLLAALTFILECALFGLVFSALRRWMFTAPAQSSQTAPPARVPRRPPSLPPAA